MTLFLSIQGVYVRFPSRVDPYTCVSLSVRQTIIVIITCKHACLIGMRSSHLSRQPTSLGMSRKQK